MRPARDLRALRLPLVVLALGAAPGLLGACGKESVAVAASPVDVVVGDPVSSPPLIARPRAEPSASPAAARRDAEVTAAPASSPEPETLPETLPKTWTAPLIPGLTFADALRKARGARDGFGRLVPPAIAAKEAAMKTWFVQSQTLVDQASRMYAAAFHAPDAAREERIDAIAEAAELDMTLARSLDEAGLGAMPAAWRADPAVASTFEDVAVGPTRRWRDEARVLARQCIDVARESGVLTEAARRCAALRTGMPIKVVKRAGGAPAAGAGCACSPGDPLCSASLGGWCAAAAP